MISLSVWITLLACGPESATEDTAGVEVEKGMARGGGVITSNVHFYGYVDKNGRIELMSDPDEACGTAQVEALDRCWATYHGYCAALDCKEVVKMMAFPQGGMIESVGYAAVCECVPADL